jgi:hypothetical protein
MRDLLSDILFLCEINGIEIFNGQLGGVQQSHIHSSEDQILCSLLYMS